MHLVKPFNRNSPNVRYRLVPMGSCSRIERIGGDKAVYELCVKANPIVGISNNARQFKSDILFIAFTDLVLENYILVDFYTTDALTMGWLPFWNA